MRTKHLRMRQTDQMQIAYCRLQVPVTPGLRELSVALLGVEMQERGQGTSGWKTGREQREGKLGRNDGCVDI